MPGITVAYKKYDQLNSYTCVIALLYDICNMDTNNFLRVPLFPFSCVIVVVLVCDFAFLPVHVCGSRSHLIREEGDARSHGVRGKVCVLVSPCSSLVTGTRWSLTSTEIR